MSETWAILAAVFIITMPLLSEAYEIRNARRDQRQVASMLTPEPMPAKSKSPEPCHSRVDPIESALNLTEPALNPADLASNPTDRPHLITAAGYE